MRTSTRHHHRVVLALLGSGTLALALPPASIAGEASAGTAWEAGPPSTTTTGTPSASAEAPVPTTTSTTTTATPTEAPPVPTVQSQSPQKPSAAPAPAGPGTRTAAGATPPPAAGGEVAHGPRAPSPSALTPALPFALQSTLTGVPSFFIESFRVPPFLLPIFQAAGAAYGVPWQVLAAINEVESDYGRDLSVSSAGAEGWMQFLPSEWAQYGVDANGDGYLDPYNPADAIFAAARYLRAAGAEHDLRAAVFAYNHSAAYVDSVMLRAQLLGGTPAELLGAITGLTEARFPVHAPAHFTDGFATDAAGHTLAGTTIYSQAGAPVLAVQDGQVAQIGSSAALGRFLVLRDGFGNTYTYAQLGDVAQLYPVLQPHAHSAVRPALAASARAQAPPTGPATAGAQQRSPISAGATTSSLAFGAAAGLEAAAPPATSAPARRAAPANRRVFREGATDVYLRPLRPGVQVIAGTVLGHLGNSSASHVFFQIRPAGAGAPEIDPKPVLDGWVALENSSVFHARGQNPFLATSPTVGQVLLESKQQLEPQVLHDGAIRLSACGRAAVQGGRVDKRVLAMLEYLSVSGLRPTAGGLRCPSSTPTLLNAPAAAGSLGVTITAVNGVSVAGRQAAGSAADTAVRKILMLQGLARPQRVVSQLSYPGASIAVANATARAIGVSFAPARARAASAVTSTLTAGGWVRLIARLGEIPDPVVDVARRRGDPRRWHGRGVAWPPLARRPPRRRLHRRPPRRPRRAAAAVPARASRAGWRSAASQPSWSSSPFWCWPAAAEPATTWCSPKPANWCEATRCRSAVCRSAASRTSSSPRTSGRASRSTSTARSCRCTKAPSPRSACRRCRASPTATSRCCRGRTTALAGLRGDAPGECDEARDGPRPAVQHAQPEDAQGLAVHPGHRRTVRRRGQGARRIDRILRARRCRATDHFFSELVRDQPVFTNFLVETAKAVTTIGARSEQLSSLIENANTTFTAVGSQQRSWRRGCDSCRARCSRATTPSPNCPRRSAR